MAYSGWLLLLSSLLLVAAKSILVVNHSDLDANPKRDQLEYHTVSTNKCHLFSSPM